MTNLTKILLHAGVGVIVASVVALRKLFLKGFPLGGGETTALISVCVLAGGLAGIAHFFSRPLASRGRLGAYLHGVVVAEVYLFAVMTALLVSDRFVPGNNGNLLSNWHWIAVGGVLCGLVWGHMTYAEQLAAEAPAPQPNPFEEGGWCEEGEDLPEAQHAPARRRFTRPRGR
jgi:hypothetical protein